jgi:hypothetical protein
MGEPVIVSEKPSMRPGYVRFETDRSFTGMGHEQYHVDQAIHRNRPPDELARRLFETGQVDEVHVYAQAVTVKLIDGASSDGLAELIGDIYIHYRPGVEVPTPESFGAEG